MLPRHLAISAIMSMLVPASGFAQTFVEIEPNSQKSEATPIFGIVNGDTIGGTITGTDTTLGSTLITTADYFRVRTAALPIGIYKHRLSQPHTGVVTSIRGLDQTGTAGVGGTPGVADITAQTATITSPQLFNQWYGFGKQEEVYWRILGDATTTSPYLVTFTTIPVTATNITPTFEAGPITISTVGLTTNDTMVHLYDANLDAIPGASNDDVHPANGVNCELTRTLAAGVYYIAMARNNTAWNHPAPADDAYVTGALMDFPNCLVRSINFPTGTQDWTFTINGANGLHNQPNLIPAFSPYEVSWWKMTVVVGAPPVVTPNNTCATAINVGTGGTHTGSFLNATNTSLASCDPGGAASRDVWYSITNPSAVVRTLHADTCGSVADTVLSVFSACGGTELTCNDDCGGSPCAATSSCVTLPMNPGQTVLIRIGDKGTGAGTTFTLRTRMLYDNDECTLPINLHGPGTYPFDTTGATTGVQGQNEGICLFSGATGIGKDLWYTYTAISNGTATITTCGLLTSPTFDTKIAIYAGSGCPTGSALACKDDDGAASCAQSGLETTLSWPVSCGSVYAIQLGGFSTTANLVGSFAISEVGSTCSTPSTPFCLGDGTGAPCPCGNTGAAGHGCRSLAYAGGAILTSSGVAGASPGTDTLVLTATDIPGPGLFFQSNALLGAPANFGDGHLCAAVGIIRLGVVFPSSGVATYPGGLTPNPIHFQGGTANGQTKHYQCWYRSVPGLCGPNNYNLTQGLTLVWGP
ncbi:MAG: hypothetical protein JNL28_12075 [Planctomycetes bacterium]|nr:hypothetical protein [Planctomycetota bacterium]